MRPLKNKHILMKKIILTCFLALPCLYGSSSSAQSKVAESPPGFSLADTARSPGQEGAIPSAQEGENQVLIYVELSKKGELDTLTFETIPFQVSKLRRNYRQKEEHIVGRRGNFFEGINPLLDQLFLFRTFDYNEPGYISIKRGEHAVLDNYLVFPGDSIMVRINPAANRISFAGPEAALFSCQYQMALAAEEARFKLPAQMMTDNPEELLNRENYRSLYEKAKNNFGGKMEFIRYGDEEREVILKQWKTELEDLPGWQVLQSYRSRISPDAFDILKADLIGNYRGEILKTFREELYGMASRNQDDQVISELNSLFIDEFMLPGPLDITDRAKSLSVGWLSYQYEHAYLKSLLTATAFTKLTREEYDGDLRAKINLRFLMEKFQQIPEKTALLNRIAPLMHSPDQIGQMEEYSSKYISGVSVQDFKFQDQRGNIYSKDDFKGKLVVFYFWTTGCGASENFYRQSIQQLAMEFENSDVVKFISVNGSSDTETWQKGISMGLYTSDKMLNLFIGEEAEEWKRHYNIHLFPQLMMMDGDGRNVEILYLGQSAENIKSQIEVALHQSDLSNLNQHTP
jgi:cytochrome oxidase Cu insertion factor (SCO1/SenC/PrrC family)